MRTLLDTVYSLSGEVTPVDSAADEDSSVLQRGMLIVGSIRNMCSIRKISAGGAVLHADMPLDDGRRLELELETGEHLDGTVVWRRGGEVGLRFDEPVDVMSIVARNLVSQPGERRRMPRVEVCCSATLEFGSRTQLVMISDIAQGGVKIQASPAPEPESQVVVTPDGLRPIAAQVRWARDGVAGLAFEQELQWQELMPWLKVRSQLPAGGFSAAPEPPLPSGRPSAPAASSSGSIQLNLPARVREGTRRWTIDVTTLTARTVEFDCYAALRLGTLLWVVLPGLEGWPARIVAMDGYRFTCEFTQALHPAVLERILASAKTQRA